MRERAQDQETGRRERGTSLVEVLVALLIFLFLMIGVLQMFVVAFTVNKGSEARTEMTYKAQQVMENLRYLNMIRNSGGTLPPNLGFSFISFADGYSFDFGDITADELASSYWGPSGANVLESATPRYNLFMAVEDGGTFWTVTVTARPNPNAEGQHYVGAQPARRYVDYVSQLPKS